MSEMIDHDIFNQLLEMDDDANHEFSKSILSDYFVQMEEKLPEMKELVESDKLEEAGKLAHFLKGSSAGVGAAIVRDLCDDMQHYTLKSSKHKEYLLQRSIELETAYFDVKKAFMERLGMT